MDNVKTDKYYFEKAINDIDAVEKYFDHKTYEEFMADSMLIDAIMFRLVQLIENIKKISPDFKASHSNIEWGNIMGFRNGIVHEYGETDYTIVYEVVSKDLLELKELFEQCL
mgnify:CR=1 FL=1|jgi:uncharacterized protein with HEPN domain